MKSTPARHIAALIERIGRLSHTSSHADGLLPVQWEILRYLDRANRFSCTPAAVTAYLGLTKGTVSQSLNTLEARGLLRKQVDPKDRRGRRLSLSAKGRLLLRRDPLAESIAAIDGLTKKSQTALADSLQAMLSARLDAQGRQPFGQCHTCTYFTEVHDDGDPHYCSLLQEALSADDAEAICIEQTAS